MTEEKKEVKNPVLDKMNELLAGEEFFVSKDDFAKFRNELRIKTNYVNTLIDQLTEGNVQRNDMATNNHKLIEQIKSVAAQEAQHYMLINLAGAEMNEMRDKLEELCKSTDFIEAGKVLQIMNDYEKMDVDEDCLIEPVVAAVTTEYES